MRKSLGLVLVVVALVVGAAAAAHILNVSYWMMPSKEKFAHQWRSDIAALEKSGKLPEGWQQIREIIVKTDNSPAQTWVIGLQPPIKKSQEGFFRLDVFVAHWIENDRYGTIIQYNLVDLRTGNTTWELSRNLQIGKIL